jgi:hypothetical protein
MVTIDTSGTAILKRLEVFMLTPVIGENAPPRTASTGGIHDIAEEIHALCLVKNL